MSINFNISNILKKPFVSAYAAQPVDEKIGNAIVQVTTLQLNENNKLQQAKQLLHNSLRQSTAQDLNVLYQTSQDKRSQLYIKNEKKELYQVFTDRVTQRINQGKANNESSEQLNSLLDRISQGAESAHSETRSVLAELGKLDPSTESYIAESSTYTRFALNELSGKIAEDEQLGDIKRNKKDFSLQVKTREGDVIDITIKQANGWQGNTYGSKISVDYEVEGNLSTSEQEALADLMGAIGSSSDSLLAGGNLNKLMGIDNFNGQQLSSFSLAMKGGDQSINYNYQQSDNKQSLTGKWSQMGEVKAKFNLQSQLGGNASDAQLARYLDILDQAAEASYKLNDDHEQSDQTSALFSNTFTDFMKLAERLGKTLDKVDQKFSQSREIANNLFNQTIKEQSEHLGLKDEQQATLKEGFNQLADFSANFIAQKDGSKTPDDTGYQANLSQKTTLDSALLEGVRTTAIKQSQDVSYDSVMIGSANERNKKYSEQYQITAAFDEKQQFKGYQQNRNISEKSQEVIYHNMGESRFSNIDKQTLSENSLYLVKEGLLENSKMQGFEEIHKGFKAGDFILSEMKFHKNHHYQKSLFSPSDDSFQQTLKSQLSIESQKRLLDELLEKL